MRKSEETRGVTILGLNYCKFTSRNPARVSGKGQESPLMVLVGRGKWGCQDPKAGLLSRRKGFETHHGGGKAAPHLTGDSIKKAMSSDTV